MHLHALWVEKAEFVVALGGAHSDHWAERMKLDLISTDIYTAYKQHGNIYMYIYIQGVTGEMCQTSGGCSLC